MNETRELFQRVLTDEPPLTLALEPVVTAGRRVRRRRRVVGASAGAVALSLVLVAAVPLVQGATRAAPTSDDKLTPAQSAIAQAIVDASPEGWTFDFSGRWPRVDLLSTTVDDGTGPTSLFVQLHEGFIPGCRWVKGAHDCTQRPGFTAKDGGMIVLRYGNPGGPYGIEAMISEPEIGTVSVRSTNWLARTDPVDAVRADPPYTAEQLEAVARAVAAAFEPYREAWQEELTRERAEPPEERVRVEPQSSEGTP